MLRQTNVTKQRCRETRKQHITKIPGNTDDIRKREASFERGRLHIQEKTPRPDKYIKDFQSHISYLALNERVREMYILSS